MLLSLFYIILALLGLGFLVFIHELGHYWMARRCGMRVESFGIGFGKPIYSFKHDGVTWNICWFLFGGYVRIAGMERDGDVEPEHIEEGFFSKSPWARLKVAIMGPLANILFAFLAFSVIWMAGGREKPFGEVNNIVGWVDFHAELYKKGVRPGDLLDKYNDKPCVGMKDHIQTAMTSTGPIKIDLERWNPLQDNFEPYSVMVESTLHPYPLLKKKGLKTTGVLSSGNYIMYLESGPTLPLESAPFLEGGIRYGDRIVWVDGQKVYSIDQFRALLNSNRVLVTIERNGKYLQKRVPRLRIDEFRLLRDQKEELTDWQWEASLQSSLLDHLYILPYNLDAHCTVQESYIFIDKEDRKRAFPEVIFSSIEEPLEKGDVIVAVSGVPVRQSHEIFSSIQKRNVLAIVQEMPWKGTPEPFSFDNAFKLYYQPFQEKTLDALVQNIGTTKELLADGFRVLGLMTPKTRKEILELGKNNEALQSALKKEKEQIEAMEDPDRKKELLELLQERDKELLLGFPAIMDMPVRYNPEPIGMFTQVTYEIYDTLQALVTGALSPQWVSGPVGIIQVMKTQWTLGFKEALFWLATISINLGLLNLLPLPVLDGGYIVLSLFEIVTKQKVRAKTLEKIVVPFAILLIGFLIFLTYNDIARIVRGLFS